MTQSLAAIDLFCGAGGLGLGLERAGFDVVCAIDNDPVAARTYERNLRRVVLQRSIEDLAVQEVLAVSRLQPGECLLLAGGPPCQGFSVQRRGPADDPRNRLLLEFLRLLTGIKPKFFLMENVTGLLSERSRHLLDDFVARATKLGYLIRIAKLDAVDFGVPQFRLRAFLVGEFVGSCDRSAFEFPSPIVRAKDRRTVRQAIGDLSATPEDGSPHPDVPNHYREARLSALNLERFRHIPPGGSRESLPDRLKLACHQRNPKHRHLDVYGRLSWDAPSVTITARFDSFTRGRFGHPEEHRSLTLREGARIQGFPDWFVFEGNREEGARQIGNAVPPDLAMAVATTVKQAYEARTHLPLEVT